MNINYLRDKAKIIKDFYFILAEIIREIPLILLYYFLFTSYQ